VNKLILKKKFWSKKNCVILICIISLFGLVSCGGKDNNIIMATDAEFPPFEYITQNGLIENYSGIDIAIGLEIAKSLNKNLKVLNCEFTSVLASIQTGRADFALAGITSDETRKYMMDFSDTYYTATQYILVREETQDITSAQDLINKKVGAIEGYTGEKICASVLKLKDLLSYKKPTDAITDLNQKKIDALVIDSQVANKLAEREENKIKIIKDPSVFETEEYAIAVRKNNQELLSKINKIIAELKSTGKLEEIIEKYSDDSI